MRLLTHTVTPQEAGLPVRTLLRRQLRISGSFLAVNRLDRGTTGVIDRKSVVYGHRVDLGLSAGYSVGGRGPPPAE